MFALRNSFSFSISVFIFSGDKEKNSLIAEEILVFENIFLDGKSYLINK